jgi:hypothetical protein
MRYFQCVPPLLPLIEETGAEVIACSVWSDQRPFTGLASILDWRLAGRLSRLAKQGFLTGSAGEVLLVPARPRLAFDKLIVVGLGAHAAFGRDVFSDAISTMVRTLEGLAVKHAVCELPGRSDHTIDAVSAADLALSALGADARARLRLVESPEDHEQMEHHAHERHRNEVRARERSAPILAP